MPKQFRKEFRTQGCTAHIRKRTDGRYVCSYEIRYRRNGYNITASATTIDEAKERFIEKLKTAQKNGTESKMPAVPRTYNGFSLYFFDKFRFRKVSEETKRHTLTIYKKHMLPAFGNTKLCDITPEMCQNFIDNIFVVQNKKRTALECFSILSQTFDMAVKHGIIKYNPCKIIFIPRYEKEHGKALSLDEERRLLDATQGTPYQLAFAVALYCGLRPNEIETATLDGRFIKAVNSKQKDGKVHYKRIPITPMLAPYLEGVTELKFYRYEAIRQAFNRIFGDSHILYDLRTTFNTRCQECGVADVAREKFMGHKLPGLNETYTDLSDKFLYEEGQKLRY